MNNRLKVSNKEAHAMNPGMVGLFFEDINFAADGGLYAELLENGSFEAVKSLGAPRDYVLEAEPLYAWSTLSLTGELAVNVNSPLSAVNPHYIRFTAGKEGDGFANKAFDGVALRKGITYKASFYAREVKYLDGDICLQLTKDGNVLSKAVVKFIPAQKEEPDGTDAMLGNCEAKIWRKYEAELIISDSLFENEETKILGCRFEILLTKTGSVEFDRISLLPSDAVEGVFRKDLFEALRELNPGFLRFPGGCIVEGTSLLRRYRWKDTVGEKKDRKVNSNLWAVQGGNTTTGWELPDCHYMQSYGIGFYEYFRLCELLSSKEKRCLPLPVLNVGVACQFRSYEKVPVENKEFEEYLQDALDLIEFANGPVTSRYGALRAQMGHPGSFELTMVAIGNEQWESRQVDFYERYRRFERAIHEVYPEILCLGSAGPFPEHELSERAWEFYQKESVSCPNFTYAVDEHYYTPPKWLYDHVDFYDNYPRNIAVFAGEYAGHDDNLCNSVEAALAEAAMLTGMERNGDVVRLASYAPLFNRIGHSQWTPDLIWFDETEVVLTPSYYVQKLFSVYSGEKTLELYEQEKQLRAEGIYLSLCKRGDLVILKAVNANDEEKKLTLENDEGAQLCTEAEVTTLTADGPFQKAVAGEGIGHLEGTKAVLASSMTNRRLCELRAPQKCVVTTKTEKLGGELLLPAKSLSVTVWKVEK